MSEQEMILLQGEQKTQVISPGEVKTFCFSIV